MLKSIIILVVVFSIISCSQPDTAIDLSGEWYYRLDDNETGEKKQWFSQEFKEDTLRLPAALRDHNIGFNPTLETKWTGSIYDSSWFFNPDMAKYRNPDSLKFPFWLTPVKRYVGKAWYQKEIIIPKSWSGKDLQLFLERPHWQTKVWIDTTLIGQQNSLSTPHVFYISTKNIEAGKHLLTICVDNAIRDVDPGMNSHSISDHTQGNWNGIVGELSLKPVSPARISLIRLMPDLEGKRVIAKVFFTNSDAINNAKLEVKVTNVNQENSLPIKTFAVQNDTNEIELEFPMGDNYLTWSEFEPNLYEMSITLKDATGVLDAQKQVFGMREFTINGKRFELNGKPVSLRGTTECCVFPLTGYPPTDVKDWNRIFEICKSFGLNHMRFHSYCPPEAAFKAADKAGIYLHVEGPSWAKYSVTLGDGKPIDQYLMEETKRIIDTYGNHPSFVMMAYGNEPSGHYVGYLENWVDTFRKYDPQRVFTGASTGRSWTIINNSDYIVRSPPRGLEWKDKQPESVFDYRDKTENQNKPYVSFEMGQWCVFPNLNEISKYTGSLKARNFELFKEDLDDKHMGDQAHDFLMASGKLQASCYKQEIEATLRTPNLAGFQLLSLNDFPGQGTALVGVLDAFWNEKGYISAGEFKEFCNEVVPLLRLPKFTYSNNETLKAELEVANFSGNTLNNIAPNWAVVNDSGKTLKEGSFPKCNIPLGNGNLIGNITVPLDFAKQAGKYLIRVNIGSYSNSWNFWVYPEKLEIPDQEGIYVCRQIDKEAEKTLAKGGKVLMFANGTVENGKNVVQYYTPVFWNTSWFRMRPPHTTGLLINDKHPVFNDFPTDYYSDLQWWGLVNNQQVMNLEYFPPEFKPIVQPIDTWFLNRRLAMLFEARVGKGKIMVCSIDLEKYIESALVSKQFYYSLINYLKSDKFNPEQEIQLKVIKELFEKKERKSWNSYIGD